MQGKKICYIGWLALQTTQDFSDYEPKYVKKNIEGGCTYKVPPSYFSYLDSRSGCFPAETLSYYQVCIVYHMNTFLICK